MKKKIIINWKFIFILIFSTASYCQVRETEKVFFLGPMANKYKSSKEYSLNIGYIAFEDRIVFFEFSGGPKGFKLKESIPVRAGQGKLVIKFDTQSLPQIGKNYSLTLGLREKGSEESEVKSLTIIKNIELVDEEVKIYDNASFAINTPNSLDCVDILKLNVNYSFIKQNIIKLSVFDGIKPIANSETITIDEGTGIEEVMIKLPNKIEGDNFKFVLNFGTSEDFSNNNTKSEEILKVKFTKPIVYSPLDLSDKSTQLSVPVNSNFIVLPGDPIYDFIKIIDKNGKVVKEFIKTNKIDIIDLMTETYYVITQSGYYFKFKKGV